MLEGAEKRGADALIFDLEDGVASSAKPEARELVAAYLTTAPDLATAADLTTTVRGPAPIWVRVNPRSAVGEEELLLDLGAAVHPRATGVVYPKAELLDDLEELDRQLSRLEAARQLPAGSMAVVPLIESAAGLDEMRTLARAPRVTRIQIGERDLMADLGIQVSDDEIELLPWRSLVVAVSRAARIEPPVGSAETAIDDLERLRASTMRLRRLGFSGRTVIHPSQIPVVRDIFRPSEAELAEARELLALYEAARARGGAVARDGQGKMVDEAVARPARRLLAESRDWSRPG